MLAARKMETEGILTAAETKDAAIAAENKIRAGILAKFHHYFEL